MKRRKQEVPGRDKRGEHSLPDLAALGQPGKKMLLLETSPDVGVV